MRADVWRDGKHLHVPPSLTFFQSVGTPGSRLPPEENENQTSESPLRRMRSEPNAVRCENEDARKNLRQTFTSLKGDRERLRRTLGFHRRKLSDMQAPSCRDFMSHPEEPEHAKAPVTEKVVRNAKRASVRMSLLSSRRAAAIALEELAEPESNGAGCVGQSDEGSCPQALPRFTDVNKVSVFILSGVTSADKGGRVGCCASCVSCITTLEF